MERLGIEDIRRVDACVRTLYVHADLSELPKRVLDAVSPLLATEVTCYTEVLPTGGIVVNVADHPDSTLDALIHVLGDYQHQHARIADYVAGGTGDARTISDFQAVAQFHRTDLYQGFYAPLGIEDQMALMLSTESGNLIGLAFNRARRAFTPRDYVVADLLMPHLRQAYANAAAVTRLRAAAKDANAALEHVDRGVVVLDRDGSVRWATARALAMLRAHVRWDARGEARLPRPLDDWIRREFAPDAEDAGQDVQRAQSFASARGSLNARLVEDRERETWLLLLDEAPIVHRDPLAAHVDQLAPRLRRVLDRLLAGDSEKQVAASLDLSPHTVHEYVKVLHRAFGVSSRSELLALWIRR